MVKNAPDRSIGQLSIELEKSRQRIAELEESEEKLKKAEKQLQKSIYELEIMAREQTVELLRAKEILEVEFSERIYAEEELSKAKTALKVLSDSSKAKSEFLASISHDLRTPLTAIIGFSELLKMKSSGELNKKQERYVDNVITSSEFLLNLINDILDLAKIESGKMDITIEKFEINKVINEVASLLKEKASENKVIIKNLFDQELRFIEADQQKFKRILLNLLGNAIKFSKAEGGTVTIITKKEGVCAYFSISDTGLGIRKEDMGKLFTKFKRLDPREKIGGTGLGLVISKQLVEMQGGRIMAESKFKEGSTFTFMLPLEANKMRMKEEAIKRQRFVEGFHSVYS